MAKAPAGTLSLEKKACRERNVVFGDSILIKLKFMGDEPRCEVI
jgi:hypothetical protein